MSRISNGNKTIARSRRKVKSLQIVESIYFELKKTDTG